MESEINKGGRSELAKWDFELGMGRGSRGWFFGVVDWVLSRWETFRKAMLPDYTRNSFPRVRVGRLISRTKSIGGMWIVLLKMPRSGVEAFWTAALGEDRRGTRDCVQFTLDLLLPRQC